MAFLQRLLGSFRRTSLHREVLEEQQHHIELAARELESQGFTKQEARRRAALQFGSEAYALEETRRQDLLPWLEDLAGDYRIAWRSLRRSPSYSLVVLIALALGIGVNTAVYSVVESVLLRGLPYPDSDRLVSIFTKTANGGRTWANLDDMQDWARDSKIFSSIAGWVSQTVNLTGTGEPDRLRGGFVTDNFFTTLGIAPVIGRSFTGAESVPGGPRVVISSWGMWQTRFGGRPDFLNSKINLNGEAFTVIGILPKHFDLAFDPNDVWLPFPTWPPYRPGREMINAAALGRLRPSVTYETAQQELNVRAQALAQHFPDTNRDRVGVSVLSLQETLAEDLRPQLMILAGAVLLALLVACANIATLTVSRVLTRSSELTVRAALGAGRLRLLAHLFSEQFLLCAGGGALGLLLAYWFTKLSVVANVLPTMMAPRVDWKVAFVCLGLTVVAAVVTGPLPAFSLILRKTLDVSRGGRSSETRSAINTRRLLVTASVALSIMLLSGAGLMVRSFNRISGVDPGFDPDNLMTLEYRMPRTRYPEREQQIDFHRRVAQEASAIPGVRSATVMMALPFSGNGNFGPYRIVGRAPAQKGSEPRAQLNRVDEHFFDAMAIPLLRGRAFSPADDLRSRPVVVISSSMAERCWPGEDPLNRQLVVSPDRPDQLAATVVGVVGDTKHSSLEEESREKAYVPFAQHPHIFGTLAVRTASDPASYASAIRKAVWRVDPDQPVWKVRTMSSLIDGSISKRRILANVMSGFSAFSLLLATIGLYGVISYTIARRAREFGIRAAMGASRSMLVRAVVGEGMRNIAAGLLLGMVCAIPASRLLRAQVYEVSVTDPQPYVAALIGIIGAALLAILLPARRAATISPASILRQD